MEIVENILIGFAGLSIAIVVWIFLNIETLECVGYCNGSETFVVQRKPPSHRKERMNELHKFGP